MKNTSIKSLLPHWEDPYQELQTNPCATKLQGIDSWIHVTHLKKAPNHNWTCTPSDDIKVKISWNWSRWYLMRQISQDVWTRPVYLFLTIDASFLWEDNASSALPKPLWKAETSSFDYSFLETASSWSWDKLVFHLLYFWRVRKFRIHKSPSSELLTDFGFLSRFMVSDFATTECIFNNTFDSKQSFEVTILL